MKALLLCVALLAVGLAAAAAAADQPAMDRARLIETLRAAGAPVERAGAAEQPFLSAKGLMIKLHGEDVQLFQYRSAVDTDGQAAAVSPDGGTVGTTKVHWIGSPHFYKKGRVLVLYVGDDPKVLKVLEGVLGPQFAGK